MLAFNVCEKLIVLVTEHPSEVIGLEEVLQNSGEVEVVMAKRKPS